MPESTPILEFDDVSFNAAEGYDSGVWHASFAVHPGELVMVRLEHTHRHLPLADAAEGLIFPDSGFVRIHGKPWRRLSGDAAAAQRGKIGRIFDGPAWISNLDVDENTTLAQRHHTRRPVQEIEAEAADLARQFGLPGLPRGRPHQVRQADLARAACVRAMLGGPELLLLERPTQEAQGEIIPPLVNAVRAARRRGAGVLWLTDAARVWEDEGIGVTRRFVIAGSQFVEKKADADFD